VGGLDLEVQGREEQDPGAVVQHAGDIVAAVYPAHENTRSNFQRKERN